MDWNQSYEKLMQLEGHEPYGCNHEQCNHVARGMFGLMLHNQFGKHHANHQR